MAHLQAASPRHNWNRRHRVLVLPRKISQQDSFACMWKVGKQTTAHCAGFRCAELHWLFSCCGGLALASSQTPTQPLIHSTVTWHRKIIEKRREDSRIKIIQFITEAKPAYTSKGTRGTHSVLPIGRQTSSHFMESRASAQVTVAWEDKYRKHEHHQFLPLSLIFYYWAWQHVLWDIPLLSWGQLSQLFPLWNSDQTTHFGWGDGGESLDLVQTLLSNSQNIGMLSTMF